MGTVHASLFQYLRMPEEVLRVTGSAKATPANSMSDTQVRPDIWASYWRGPRLTCALSSQAGTEYPQPLVDVWNGFFSSLHDGARILDVGTGNGAIAIIANDSAKSRGCTFEIHASDQSDIDPGAYLVDTGLSLAGIHFHARTPTEALTFQDAYFDAVTGQFALEYADMPSAVGEISRVLKTNGVAHFLLHMLGSNIFDQTVLQLGDIDVLLDKMQLLQKARRMMIAAYALEAGSGSHEDLFIRAQTARAEYLESAKEADRSLPVRAYKELFVSVLRVVAFYWDHRRRYDLGTFLARAEEMENEIRMARMRHEAMCGHALDDAGIRALGELFENHGFTPPKIEVLKISLSGKPAASVGWELSSVLVSHGRP